MYSPIPKGTPATELSPNESDFSNSQVTQLLAQARTTLDITKQRQAFRDVFELVRDTCGELVPVQLESAWVVKKQLQGVVLNPANVATFTGAYFA
jgi:ABC-type transport system substrate-binding protein